MEWLKEVGIFYGRYDEGFPVYHNEQAISYTAFHHPTKKRFARKIVVLGSEGHKLINHWNSFPETGWSFYTS